MGLVGADHQVAGLIARGIELQLAIQAANGPQTSHRLRGPVSAAAELTTGIEGIARPPEIGAEDSREGQLDAPLQGFDLDLVEIDLEDVLIQILDVTGGRASRNFFHFSLLAFAAYAG